MSFRAWQERLLIALARRDGEFPDDYIDLGGVAREDAPDFNPGWIGKAHGAFVARGWIIGTEVLGEGPDSGYLARLTADGLERAEDLMRNVSQTPGLSIPASDRIVRIDDNSPEKSEAARQLVAVEQALESGANDLPLEAQEREVVRSELRSLRQRIESGWIRLGELWQAVAKSGTLVWLAEKTAGLAFNAVVGLALAAVGFLLTKLVG